MNKIRITRALVLLFSALCMLGVSAAEKKKILFLAGNPSHSNGEHEFRAGCMLLADALNESGLEVEAKVHFYGWPEDESIFDGVDACIIYADAGGRFGQKYAFLDKKVKEGMGIMFMHYGVHPSKPVGEKYFMPWIGGFMETGWSVNPHWIADLVPEKDHPIARGMQESFTAYDEFYFNMRFPTKKQCDCCHPVATAIPTPDKIVRYINLWNEHGEKCFGTKQALMWCRAPETGGRGIGFVGGHYHRNWAIDEFRKLVLNAIVWTARMEVPKEGVKSKTVTKEMLNKNLDRPNKNKPIELPTEALLQQKPMKQPDLKKKKQKKKKKVTVVPNDKKRVLAFSRMILATDEDRSHKFSVAVDGLEQVQLHASEGSSNANDWIGWVDVSFLDAKGKKIGGKLKIANQSQGWGKLGINKSAGGKAITINGKQYAKGFGGHATSSITLEVPKGAAKLVATGGLDDGGAIRDGEQTAASVKFSIVNAGGAWEPTEEGKHIDISHFKVPEGMEVSVWAKSPMLFNPTNMDIDDKGRIWVAEGVNYRRKANRRAGGDRIVVLQDTNGDGKADKSHTFVQEKSMECPLGVAVFDNVIVVPQPPHMIVYTDVDRNLKFDPKVDKREVLLTGFNARQHDHSLHSLTAGPDGKWYFNNGNCGAIFKDKSGKTFNMNGVYRGGGGEFFMDNHKLNGKASDDGFVWTSGFGVRMNPDGTNAEIFGHGYRNSYEQAVNSLGNIYQNDNDDYSGCRNSYVLEYGSAGFFTRDGQRTWRSVMRPGQPVPRAHWRQDDPGTFDVGDVYGIGSPTGVTFYENGALGDKWAGTYLACEPAQNAIFGYNPKVNGSAFDMKRFNFTTTNTSGNYLGADSTKKLRSQQEADDTVLFRPSDVCIGPDGAMYFTDWYDGRVGGHGTMDNSCSGTIYRIAPKGFKPNIPQFDIKTIEGQITALSSPAVNVRHLGFRELQKNKAGTLDAVKKLMSHPNKWVAARGVWLLPHLGEQGLAECKKQLSSDDHERRLTAYRALRRAGVNILPYAKQLANDPVPFVRKDVALSLRAYNAEETKDIFVTIAKGYNGNDKNYVESIGLGAENKEEAIWNHLKAKMVNGGSETWSDAFAKITWRLWNKAAVADLKARAENAKLSIAQRSLAVESLAFINDRSAADALLSLAGKTADMKKDAAYWLLKRGTGEWRDYGILADLKKLGIYDPDKIKVSGIQVPAPPKTKLPALKDILALKGDPKKGKQAIMRCILCHKVEELGVNYGPALKGWGKTQSREAIARSILDPSADIAHGFKGYEVILKDGTKVHGLLMRGDPHFVTSTNGITQMIPAKKVKTIKPLGRSLMFSADQLGLTAQDIADITAFMRVWGDDPAEEKK